MNAKCVTSLYTVLAAATSLVLAELQVVAQEKSLGIAVIYPIVYSRGSGSSGSRETAVQSVRSVLQKGGYTLVSDSVASSTWKSMRIPAPSAKNSSKMRDIVKFGEAVKARYVVSPVFDFHSRSIWVDLGPKTVSTVTVSVNITDVSSNKVVYVRKNVEARSDEKFDAVKAGADLLLTPLVTVVSGGPKTPHEQRAAQIAVFKAMKDWVRHSNSSTKTNSIDRR